MIPSLLLSVLANPSAGAIPVGGDGPLAGTVVQVNERLIVRWYRVDDVLENFEDLRVLDYGEQVDRLTLTATKGWLTLGVQADEVTLFANRYFLDEVETWERDLLDPALSSPWPAAFVRLEKVYAQAQGASGELRLGDTYVSFGRGIALALVRNSEIDIDTSVRGARGVVHLGAWDLSVVTGFTNPQQVLLENPNLDMGPDDLHEVAAVRVERFGPVAAGLHAVTWKFARASDDGSPFARYGQVPDVAVVGGNVEASGVGGLDLYLEGDWFGYRSADLFVEEEPRPGYALYGSTSVYPGRFTVLLEAKRYLGTERMNAFATPWGYEVAAPPSLDYERAITEDSSAEVNSNDIAGARLKVQYAGREGLLVPSLSLGAFRDADLGGLHFNGSAETIAHPVAGVTWIAGDVHVLANAGARADVRDGDVRGDLTLHGDLDVVVPVGALGHLELGGAVLRFRWGENDIQQTDYWDVTHSLALHHGERWSFLVHQDFSDNPLVRSTGNLGEDLYLAGEVQFKPTPAVTTSLFAGAYKAGIRCAGGQCRSVPGFKGLRLSVEGSF
ncbi:MAG: hypothetical protein JXB39_03250 [Deltaproteobacteria bacterium]|nr:hypothetical protein [Deltaproteobacteria bacterium]